MIKYLPLSLKGTSLGVLYKNAWFTEVVHKKSNFNFTTNTEVHYQLTKRDHVTLAQPDIVLINSYFDNGTGSLIGYEDIIFSPLTNTKHNSIITDLLKKSGVIRGMAIGSTTMHVKNIPEKFIFFDEISKSEMDTTNINEVNSTNFDPVKKPKGYALDDEGTELQDLMPTLLGKFTGYEAFIVGNIIKYTIRFKDKNGVEDLNKVKQYTDMLIKMQEKG